ncbi:MAG: thiol-disulfide isomerase [Flavobacteriaceae bacterium]|nr:MAG: thiol-disulfide isomerase [Flavobacteriaceae bacterium]
MKHFAMVLFLLFSWVLSGQEWKENYDIAIAQALDEDKPIVLVFAGSDWCAPCIKLDKNIWQSSEFASYASEHYILYKADFPRKKINKLSKEKEEVNAKLANTYNSKGYFPLVVILNEKGDVYGTTGYANISPKEYISLLNTFIK